jgi:hypothetical protein
VARCGRRALGAATGNASDRPKLILWSALKGRVPLPPPRAVADKLPEKVEAVLRLWGGKTNDKSTENSARLGRERGEKGVELGLKETTGGSVNEGGKAGTKGDKREQGIVNTAIEVAEEAAQQTKEVARRVGNAAGEIFQLGE